jgi:NADH-quinone oxidoreductase subunit N
MEIDAVWGLLALVAVASIVAGNLLALRQPNLKRLLAYSSIAHMGYFLVAILASEGGADLDVALLYLLVYCVLSLGAFACVTLASSSERESSDFSDFSGLFWRSPWLAFALSVMFLGLAGIPLTAGFIAKFQLFFQAATASEWGLLAAVIVGSAIGLYYYLRLIFQMLMLPDSVEPEPGSDARVGLRDLGVESLASLVVLGILTLIVLWSGVYPEPLLSFVEAVAQAL